MSGVREALNLPNIGNSNLSGKDLEGGQRESHEAVTSPPERRTSIQGGGFVGEVKTRRSQGGQISFVPTPRDEPEVSSGDLSIGNVAAAGVRPTPRSQPPAHRSVGGVGSVSQRGGPRPLATGNLPSAIQAIIEPGFDAAAAAASRSPERGGADGGALMYPSPAKVQSSGFIPVRRAKATGSIWNSPSQKGMGVGPPLPGADRGRSASPPHRHRGAERDRPAGGGGGGGGGGKDTPSTPVPRLKVPSYMTSTSSSAAKKSLTSYSRSERTLSTNRERAGGGAGGGAGGEGREARIRVQSLRQGMGHAVSPRGNSERRAAGVDLTVGDRVVDKAQQERYEWDAEVEAAAGGGGHDRRGSDGAPKQTGGDARDGGGGGGGGGGRGGGSTSATGGASGRTSRTEGAGGGGGRGSRPTSGRSFRSNPSHSGEEEEDPEKSPPTSPEPTGPDEGSTLPRVVRRCALLMRLGMVQRSRVYQQLQRREVAAGEELFRQGDTAMHFYIVESGEAVVRYPVNVAAAMQHSASQLGALLEELATTAPTPPAVTPSPGSPRAARSSEVEEGGGGGAGGGGEGAAPGARRSVGPDADGAAEELRRVSELGASYGGLGGAVGLGATVDPKAPPDPNAPSVATIIVGPGEYFGEHGLLAGIGRTSTVRAKHADDGGEGKAGMVVWTLEKDQFLEDVAEAFRRQRDLFVALLSDDVPILEGVDPYLVLRMCDEAYARGYEDGDTILRQGHSDVRGLLVMESGEASVTQTTRSGEQPTEVWRLRRGEVFGDVALVSKGPHTATVTASGAVQVVVVPEHVCWRVLPHPALHVRMQEALNAYQYVNDESPPHIDLDELAVRKPMRNMRNLQPRRLVSFHQNDRMMAHHAAMKRQRLEPTGFHLLDVLGAGATGTVRAAEYGPKKKRYAIKVISKAQIQAQANGMDHLRAERMLTTSLSHPFIVNVYGHFQDKETVYVVMEELPGGTLHEAMRRHPDNKLSEDDARVVCAEVLLGLEYLHSQNTLHRDLKPANILLDDHGHAKIADFGFAKRVWCDERAFSLCGTLEYIAPEVLDNRGGSRSADMWSLGIILYQLLTGRPPFRDRERRHNIIFEKVLSAPLEVPSGLSRAAADLIRGLLNREPRERMGGAEGPKEDIKDHDWFKGLSWRDVAHQKVPTGLEPYVVGPDGSGGGGEASANVRSDIDRITDIWEF